MKFRPTMQFCFASLFFSCLELLLLIQIIVLLHETVRVMSIRTHIKREA